MNLYGVLILGVILSIGFLYFRHVPATLVRWFTRFSTAVEISHTCIHVHVHVSPTATSWAGGLGTRLADFIVHVHAPS